MKKDKSRTKKKLPKGQNRYIPTQEEVERRNAEITRKQQMEKAANASETESDRESLYMTDSQDNGSENENSSEKKKMEKKGNEKENEKETQKVIEETESKEKTSK
ncbi:hypothetical protein, conserved [Plasmodium gonderi]|uniref:Uncharacterized protein n=1 Tax=Plasmodium gonderi TaxID=77519 RepID=A0A1Y1JFF7_PLAGO|nr:hypothetical protein, conserved [Plasmodium gonderi]GAW81261.1 hypothetical protein, conserved [Plasmodium gonderi]